MSPAWVVDSSVALAWVHPDQTTPQTENLLARVEAGAGLVVPTLWFVEIANALLCLQRRKRLSPGERKSALEMLSGLNPVVDDESAYAAFGKTSELADKHGLTAYDATYLELALRLKLPLASRDGALTLAARRCGLSGL